MKYIMVAALSSVFSVLLYSQTTQKTPEGAQPFIPQRIDWLTTTLQASLRDERIDTDGYLLQITSPDADTILIYVRYLPTVNRQAMNTSIDAARQVIQIKAKSYDWDKWVRVREDIQMVKPQ
jgi:chemotaxis regulatin CheY-phosphate phosphatase CheZ